MTRPWFKVARGIHDHPRFARVELCEVACATWLFDRARHTPGDGLDAGQLRATYTDLVRAWRWERRGARPEEMVRRLLRRWSSDPDPMIAFEPEVVGGAKVGIVITVLRYADWQGSKGVRRATDPPTDLQGDLPTDQPTDIPTDLNPRSAKQNPAHCDGPSDGRRDGPADGPMVGGRDDLLLTRDDLRRETVETRAGARDLNPSLPGLESPEGDDRHTFPAGREHHAEIPTSPAATSAPAERPPAAVDAGVGPGAVDRAALGAEVNRVWADEFKRNGKRRGIDPGNHWSGKDATKALDQIKALAIYPLAEREGAMAALAEFRRVAKLHLERDHLQSRGWPLWALAEDWHELASGGAAGRAPKRETPAQRSGHWTEEDVRRATEQSQRTLAIIRENNARRGVR